jgi:hypothetical protein
MAVGGGHMCALESHAWEERLRRAAFERLSEDRASSDWTPHCLGRKKVTLFRGEPIAFDIIYFRGNTWLRSEFTSWQES